MFINNTDVVDWILPPASLSCLMSGNPHLDLFWRELEVTLLMVEAHWPGRYSRGCQLSFWWNFDLVKSRCRMGWRNYDDRLFRRRWTYLLPDKYRRRNYGTPASDVKVVVAIVVATPSNVKCGCSCELAWWRYDTLERYQYGFADRCNVPV